ncbi:hypothetical protein TcG_11104 [Trypanosoma cruzi]|uniref:Uncharacterized protein n=1 Tax=Trypanosoma cruzi TaxID=5693 RepID=A0A2V2VU61_TRYCR|nr:hypothetical protein C4B63_11g379 [Trypanosoma cruzi]RNF03539.1 hypothetical protein TcG_11104 [Trypanosoma cruzi]
MDSAQLGRPVVFSALRCRGSRESTASLPAALYCWGSTVLKLPVYCESQRQCRKTLSRIAISCSSLELINIYSREQCILVAGDVQASVFHFIRLVFVGDTAHRPSPTVPSPSLYPADRCPLLTVQLFGSANNALVKLPLRTLQDYCLGVDGIWCGCGVDRVIHALS